MEESTVKHKKEFIKQQQNKKEQTVKQGQRVVSYRTRQAHVGENYTRCGLSKHKRPGGLGLMKTTEVKNEAPEHKYFTVVHEN